MSLTFASLAPTFGTGCSSSDFSSSTGSKGSSKNGGVEDEGEEASDDLPPNATIEGETEGEDFDSSGGSDVNDLDQGRVRQVFAGDVETEKVPVDIVFAMDTSLSMYDEKASLESGMATFITAFETKAKGSSYEIYVMGSNFQFPTGTAGKITKIDQTVGSYNALEILKKFLSGQLKNPKPLRTDAQKQLIVVSDDDARGEVASTFLSFLDSTSVTNGKTSVNGIVGLASSAETSSCRVVKIGAEYVKLGADPEYGGLIQDLCKTDWGDLLDDLATKIIKETAKGAFVLKHEADESQSVTVAVDGAKVPAEDWDYDAATHAIVFQDDKKPLDGAKVVVVYTPKK